MLDDARNRYARQEAFAPLGRAGQQRLRDARVALVGCGALGAHIAEMLTRAGIGRLRIVDRDFVELTNLQRQALFDEDDVAANLPKAEAAARKLRRINSDVNIEPLVGDVNPDSIASVLDAADLLLDGTDNLLTRFVLNDAAVQARLPWIYGACLGSRGMGMVIPPGGRPCLRCVLDQPAPPGQLETCETAGILISPVATVAAFEVIEAIKILTGHHDTLYRSFWSWDLWTNERHDLSLEGTQAGCPCCARGQYDYLEGKGSFSTVSLCGQQSVQIRPTTPGAEIDLDALAKRLASLGPLQTNPYLLRIQMTERNLDVTIFRDGRAIIKGTDNKDLAQAAYAQLIGH